MLRSADELRQELADLRARIKPQAEWTSIRDRLDQLAIGQRIRMLESNLETSSQPQEKE